MTYVTKHPRSKRFALGLVVALSACAGSEDAIRTIQPTSFAAVTFTVRDASGTDVRDALTEALRRVGMRVLRADAFPGGYIYVLAEQRGGAEFVGTQACYDGTFNLEERNWNGPRAPTSAERVRQVLQVRFGEALTVYTDRRCQHAL